MKKLVVVVAFVAFIVLALHMQAQDLSMIRSQDKVRNYQMKVSVHGSRSVWSESIDWNDPSSVTSVFTNDTHGEAVLDAIFRTQLRYSLINSNDNIRGYGYLYDGDWNVTFFAYTEYPAGTTTPKYRFWMQDVVLPVTNVASAEILVLSENDGSTVSHIPLTFRNGRPVFPWWYAGAPNGILVVRFTDGTTVKYDMWDPVPESATHQDETASFGVDGHYIYRFGAKDAKPVIKITELYAKPSVYVENDIKQIVTVDVLGVYSSNNEALVERPLSLIAEDQETGELYSYSLQSTAGGNGLPKIELPKGLWRITFEWQSFMKPGSIYDGKG